MAKDHPPCPLCDDDDPECPACRSSSILDSDHPVTAEEARPLAEALGRGDAAYLVFPPRKLDTRPSQAHADRTSPVEEPPTRDAIRRLLDDWAGAIVERDGLPLCLIAVGTGEQAGAGLVCRPAGLELAALAAQLRAVADLLTRPVGDIEP